MDSIASPRVTQNGRRVRMSGIVLAVAWLATTTSAQQIFHGGTDLVLMSVTVVDGANRLVAGLEQEDFQVFEDNVQQQISDFSRLPQPIAMSLLIDTSTSMEPKLPIAQEAAAGFVRRMGPKDTAQIIDFDSSATILVPFTSDKAELDRAIRRTEAGGSTSLYNAVYTAISGLKRMRQDAGPDLSRQAIVLLSDGEDTSSIVPYEDVLDLAKRSQVVVYAIGLKEKTKEGAQPSSGWREAEFVLRSLAQETGGHSYFADDVSQLPGIYGQIADELANQYSIGYVSKNTKRDGAWRKILVRPIRPNMTARTKAGYFGPAVSR